MAKWSEKSPALKILWIWTLGTAAILVTAVVRTRLQDMQKVLNEEDAVRSEASGHAAYRDEVLDEE